MSNTTPHSAILRVTSCLAAVFLASCASVQPKETHYIEHATIEWPLLTAQRAATKQAARLAGWVQEAERRHVWETDQMLPIAPVPTFGFAENDQPALFTAGNRIPPPPVVEDTKLAASGVRQARLESLHDCALTFGVRQGMREQMARIQHVLGREDVAKMMDDAFDFAPVMLTRYLVPPSVTESRDELEQQNAGTLRLREARYHVVTQARFTSVRPNWRGFMHQIYVGADERSPCNAGAFGLSAAEQDWWQRAESLSRIQGIEAANLVFHNSLERLANTHTGMLKYHEWSWRGLIDIPQIAQSKHFLTLDPKSQDARLQERLLRVTHLPKFDERRATWEASAPHMEESKAAAVDLALPVCSGAGCSNDHFAFGGLRHAASEEYFIHPTLMLRGAGGHEVKSAPAALPATTRRTISRTTSPARSYPVRRQYSQAGMIPDQPPRTTSTAVQLPAPQNVAAPKATATPPRAQQPAITPAPKEQATSQQVAPSKVAPAKQEATPSPVRQTQPAPKDAGIPARKEHVASAPVATQKALTPAAPVASAAPKAATASVPATPASTVAPASSPASAQQAASAPAPVAQQVFRKKTRTPKYRAKAASATPPMNESARAAAIKKVQEMDERYRQRVLQQQSQSKATSGTKASAAHKKSSASKATTQPAASNQSTGNK